MNKKVILITGASSGIGKETALYLLDEGHVVYGAARRVEQMQDIVDAGGFAIPMDVTSEEQIQAAVDRVVTEQGRIDVLFNNAGYGLYGAVEDIPLDTARAQFEVNIFGLARITQMVLPHMRKRNSGTIINTSSMGGKMYTPMGAWYHATKHALEGWSDCLRLELAEFNINVVIIEPGAINTGFGSPMQKNLEQFSVDGPYTKMATGMLEASKRAYSNGGSGSPASVVAKAVSHAVNARKPRTRYAIGKYAKPMIFLRRIVGDRLYDRMVMQMVRNRR